MTIFEDITNDSFPDDIVLFNKILFVINNFPNVVHEILFSHYNYVSPTFYEMNLNNNEITHNNINRIFLQDMVDMNIRYLFVRINIRNNGYMDHVNCMIVDKYQNVILVYEPQYKMKYNIDIIKIFMKEVFDELNITEYQYITSSDLGFGFFNSLQKYDYFCQTYILLIYMIIVKFHNILDSNFHLFCSEITYEKMEHFYSYLLKKIPDKINLDNIIPNIHYRYIPNKSINFLKNYFTKNKKNECLLIDGISYFEL